MARISLLVLWAVCLFACYASSEYTVMAHGRSVVQQHYDGNPFGAKATTSVDLTATCDECKRAYPTPEGAPLDPRCARACGFGFHPHGMGMPVTSGEAAARRMGIGSPSSSTAPAPSASASASASASSNALSTVLGQVKTEHALNCRNAAKIFDLQNRVGVDAIPEPKCVAKK